MMRKLAMAMVVSGALGSGYANALGLGEIKMNSGLNQPLDAEVKLTNVGDLSKNQILPNLASHNDFSRAGVERVFFLTGIQFDVELDGKGGAVVHLTTDRIVREPYLNFLIELHWPSGRLLREYTALLDPPLFSSAPPVALTQAATNQPAQVAPKTAPVATYSAPSYSSAPLAAPQQTTEKRDGTVRVKKNDTLWGIAKENRPDRSVTVRQTMLAIQQHNPDAFIRNNINLLKSGKVLRIPEVEEIRRVSSTQAYVETARQNKEWASKRTIDGTQNNNVTAATNATSGVEQGGLLKLVAEDVEPVNEALSENASGGSTDGVATGSGSSAGEDSSAQGSGAAIVDVENLEQELLDLQHLMTLKQEQLALLQAAQAKNASAESEGSAQLAAEELAAEVDSELQVATGSATEQVDEATDTPTALVADESAVAEDLTGEGSAEDAKQDEAAKIAEIEAAAAEEARPEESILDILANNPLYIGVMIVVILGALILLGAISRRRNEEKDYPQDLQQAIDASDNEVEFADEFEDEMAEVEPVANDSVSANDEPLVAAGPEKTTDDSRKLLDEADVYIAYGRYERAVEILQPAVNNAPQNTALRLKLAEIFLATNDQAGLTQQEEDLQAIGDADSLADLDELKGRYADSSVAEASQAETSKDDFASEDDYAAMFGNTAETQQDNVFEDLDFELPEAAASEAEESDVTTESDDNLVEFTSELDEDFLDIEADDSIASGSEQDKHLELDTTTQSSSDNADDMDFLIDTDESATKLELAKAYIDMADTEAAQEILNEVVSEGSDEQQQEAKTLLENLV